MSGRLLTSEPVTEGHPGKRGDQISDGILDALLTIPEIVRRLIVQYDSSAREFDDVSCSSSTLGTQGAGRAIALKSSAL